MDKKGTVITGTIGGDTHVVGTRMMQYAFEQAGFEAVCLGAFVTQEEFVRAAVETDADAILVSSIYGQAELDCVGLREKCVEAGLADIVLYLGGNVAVEYRAEEWPRIERKFQEMGFNRVYPPGTLPRVAIDDLERDLGIVGG